jgi:hypothetical protein
MRPGAHLRGRVAYMSYARSRVRKFCAPSGAAPEITRVASRRRGRCARNVAARRFDRFSEGLIPKLGDKVALRRLRQSRQSADGTLYRPCETIFPFIGREPAETSIRRTIFDQRDDAFGRRRRSPDQISHAIPPTRPRYARPGSACAIAALRCECARSVPAASQQWIRNIARRETSSERSDRRKSCAPRC